MLGLIAGQISMWVILVLGLAGIWVITLTKNRDQRSALILSVALPVAIFTCYGLGIRFGTGVDDFCVLNGHVVKATFSQHWTEEYYTTEDIKDSKGNVTGTRRVRHETYHPDAWRVDTTVGDNEISAGRYGALTKRFGNERKTDSGHPGQCSIGDGGTWTTTWKGNADTIVPWSDTKNIVNWVKASKGTVEKRAGAAGFQIPAYPGLVESEHGPRQPRVIMAWGARGGLVDPAWVRAMEWDMDVLADQVGDSKQANPLIVLTNQGPAFYEALRAAWINGKKNDVILVAGVNQWPVIEWSEVMCWSKDTFIGPTIKTGLTETDLNDRAKVMKIFGGAIMRHFQRQRMAEFEYLKNGIDIPLWIPLVSILVAAACCVAILLAEPQSLGGWNPRSFPSPRFTARY